MTDQINLDLDDDALLVHQRELDREVIDTAVSELDREQEPDERPAWLGVAS